MDCCAGRMVMVTARMWKLPWQLLERFEEEMEAALSPSIKESDLKCLDVNISSGYSKKKSCCN